MTISERLFDILNRQGLKMADLCRVLDVRSNTVANWKQRNTDPPAKYVLPICDLLGCSVEYLLTGQEAKKEPVLGLSENGREMLRYFERLTDGEQKILIGEARGVLLARDMAGEPPASASSDVKAG